MVRVALNAHLLVSTPEPEIVEVDDIKIRVKIEAFMTITLPLRISSNTQETLHCKDHTVTNRNVMQFHASEAVLRLH